MYGPRKHVLFALVAALLLLAGNVTLCAASKPQAVQSTDQSNTKAKPKAKKKTTGDTSATAAPATAPATKPAAAPAAKSTTPAASTATPAPATTTKAAPAQQTAPAHGNGMVWVNTDSGIYHKPGSRYYGKTKQGKYMSEADAIKAGYHASQRN